MTKKDSRGRNLKDYESQMPDGRYRFRYTDRNGNRKSVYSWRLTKADKTPTGKRDSLSLREKEKEILKDIEDGIDTAASNMTLNEAWEKYISMKTNLKPSTLNNYNYTYDHFVRNAIGYRKLNDFKYSDIKAFYIGLMKAGVKANTLNTVHAVVFPVFQLAFRDDIIRKNPSADVLSEIKKNSDCKTEPRHALTIEEQDLLMEYMNIDFKCHKWLPLITFFLGTGCRVSEVVGLRWCDVDFENNTISINHNTMYRRRDGKYTWFVSTPKTKAGIRTIPLFAEVREALYQVRRYNMALGIRCNQTIDGYTDFIFLNRDGKAFSTRVLDHAFNRIQEKANEWEAKRAKAENREPVVIRHFSVHNLRHTFCTRLCEVESNLKLIQDIMGHADVTTTMNIYNEIQESKKKSAFEELEGKIKIC